MHMDDMDELRAWLIALRTPGLGPAGCASGWRRPMATSTGRWRGCARRAPSSATRRTRGWRSPTRPCWLPIWPGWPSPDIDCCVAPRRIFRRQLENIPQPPAALFVAGDASLLLHPQVAIVGARGASAAGLAHARAFARSWRQAGFVITSGMADGIDGAAHAAAMDARCRRWP